MGDEQVCSRGEIRGSRLTPPIEATAGIRTAAGRGARPVSQGAAATVILGTRTLSRHDLDSITQGSPQMLFWCGFGILVIPPHYPARGGVAFGPPVDARFARGLGPRRTCLAEATAVCLRADRLSRATIQAFPEAAEAQWG